MVRRNIEPAILSALADKPVVLLNLADVARDAGRPHATATRCLAPLESVFMVHRLPAWSENPGRRLVKSPKLHRVPPGDRLWLLPLPALWAA
jgi:predicted AAA+ superfamily ATPase